MTDIHREYLTSKYKYVFGYKNKKTQVKSWYSNLPGMGMGTFKTEKEAALAVDTAFIQRGKEPMNILKRVTKEESV